MNNEYLRRDPLCSMLFVRRLPIRQHRVKLIQTELWRYGTTKQQVSTLMRVESEE